MSPNQQCQSIETNSVQSRHAGKSPFWPHSWIMPTLLCMECQHLTWTNYSLPKILTRVVLPSLGHLSASERLSYLHWLPVHYRIKFKIVATCQPSDLHNLLQVYHPSQALRSSTQQLLRVPYMSTDFGRHAFSYSSPATWNSIPISIKSCSSLHSFKHRLVLLYSPAHIQLMHSVRPPSDCPCLWFMLNAWLHVCVINFHIIIIIIIHPPSNSWWGALFPLLRLSSVRKSEPS